MHLSRILSRIAEDEIDRNENLAHEVALLKSKLTAWDNTIGGMFEEIEDLRADLGAEGKEIEDLEAWGSEDEP